MSSWYDIKIQGFEIFSNSSQLFSEWYFQKSDRITREGDETNNGSRRYLYVTDAATVRRRLALQGCDRRLLESEFEQATLDIEKEFEYATEYYPDDVGALREAITGMTLDDWLSKLKVIVNEEPNRRVLHDKCQHTDAVINYLTSVGKWNSENRYSSFPCITPDCYALAVLEVTPDDAEVIMDCTSCVQAGSIAAFDTYIEHLQPCTYLYETFKASIHDIENIMHTVEVNHTLAKLLFSGVITALETYLSDTIRKLIFNNQAVIRKYVEFEDSFQRKIKINEVYLTLEKLERDVSALLGKTSFHNIEEASRLYKNVLMVDFQRDESLELKKAVEIRHDIVHRNGKTFKGEYRTITEQDVTALISSVVSFLKNIDDQIRNNLLLYENDNESDWSPNPRFQIIMM